MQAQYEFGPSRRAIWIRPEDHPLSMTIRQGKSKALPGSAQALVRRNAPLEDWIELLPPLLGPYKELGSTRGLVEVMAEDGNWRVTLIASHNPHSDLYPEGVVEWLVGWARRHLGAGPAEPPIR